MRKTMFLTVVLATAATLAAQTAGRKLIDLTYSFSSETIYWPNAEGFKLRVDADGINEKGYFYSSETYSGGEHGGTHFDAPRHFAQGGAPVDQIPVDRLIAPGIVVDVRENAAKDPDYLVSVADFQKWEKANGRIPDGCILLVRTGWGKFYPDRKKYLGTERRGEQAVAELHFPGIDPAAATWIAGNRKISVLGLDTASIDRGQSQLFETHRILFKAGICALENVANLDQLPEKGFEIIALPMKIQGGSGAPVRIVAVLK